MENINDMLVRLNSLDETMEKERKEAARRLRHDLGAFIARYGYIYKSKNGSYSFNRNDGEVKLGNLNIEEMERLHKFMIDTLNNDIQYQEDMIARYIDLCL